MWVYLNNNGISTTRIPHGEIIRQRGSFNIYIAFEIEDFKVNGMPFSSDVALLNYLKNGNFVTTIHFRKPSETDFNEFRYIDEDHITIKTFKKTHDSEVTYDLVDGKRYVVYSFHGDASLIDEYGTYEASITFYKVDDDELEEGVQAVHSVLKTGNIQFYVEKTYGEAEPNKNITISQYDYLLSIIQQFKPIENNVKDVGVFETYSEFAIYCKENVSDYMTPRAFVGYVEESSSNVIGLVSIANDETKTIVYSSDYQDVLQVFDENGEKVTDSNLKNINITLSDGYYINIESTPIEDSHVVNKGYADSKYALKIELFSGDYNDLTNKPTLFSGYYSDLMGKPNIYTKEELDIKFNNYWDKNYTQDKFNSVYNSLNNYYLKTTADAKFATKSELFSGSYNDLTDKPTLSDLEDDVGYVTHDYVENFVKPSIPTKTSQLTNDSSFVNQTALQAVIDSIPKDTVNKTYVDDLVSRIPKFEILAVDALPTEDISTTTVYLLRTNTSESDLYDEYIYVDDKWELLGSAKIDLSEYAKLEDLPTKVSELENDSKFTTETQVTALFQKLNTNLVLKFYCIKDVEVIVNGESTVYPPNSNVDIKLSDNDTFEIVCEDDAILSLSGFPGAISTYYTWLNGVQQFTNILFDMNTLEMYEKWNQGHQGEYGVQFAQYVNCIFWNDMAYFHGSGNPSTLNRTNYILYQSSQLPLCYATDPANTYKPFYLAYGVQSDPNWMNSNYIDSYAKVTSATQTWTYYGARTIGVFNLGIKTITLPKDCRGLMYYAMTIENVGPLDAVNVTNFGTTAGTYSLKRLYMKNLKKSINISWSPLEQISLQYIIENAANTSAITISLSPYTWYRTSEETKALAASKNITLKLVTGNYVEMDKRTDIIKFDGDGTLVLHNDGTYKPINLDNYATKDELGDINSILMSILDIQ